jgi:hypothetical protein
MMVNVDAAHNGRITSDVPAKSSALVDTRVVYCCDNLNAQPEYGDSATAFRSI